MSDTPLPPHWDHSVDLLVVGSGNGAMTGAICAHDMGAGDVLVIEKGQCFGGTSALSGGGVWVPCNRYAKAAGADDSFAAARTYLANTIPQDMVAPEMLDTYLQNAPRMIDFLHNNTRVRYESLERYPDYFSNVEGARSGHRSMEPRPIAMSELGDEVRDLLPHGVMYMFDKFAISQVEASVLSSRLPGWKRMAAGLILRYYLDLAWLVKGLGVSRRTTGGGAGIIRLKLSMNDRGIPLWLSCSLKDLYRHDGRICGARVERDGKVLNIECRKAVLLAAGGFEHNQQMREQYLPSPTDTRWSAGCHSNTGDAIRIARKLGAATRLMNNAWWCTTIIIPGRPYPFLSIVTKSMPGSIVVNPAGRRFSNESQNYMSYLKETFAQHSETNPCIPSYMIFDSDFKKRNNVYPVVGPDRLLPQRYFDEGLVAIGNSIEALAQNAGIDPAGLAQTVAQFNTYAQSGNDPEFHRGDAEYDRYYGDPQVRPNPCLGPILKPPFYAVRLEAGDFGTQGGLATNVNAAVLDNNDQVIPGLYACGNCSAAVLPTYPGPGSTLGPAMTFAYQAARHITDYTD